MSVAGTAKGPANGNWKGGRSTTSHGYVLVRVGKEHPLADVRGYAYEHRLVGQSTLGRPLLPGEEIHHRDKVRSNNQPGNLAVEASRAEHMLHHRKPGSLQRLPGEPNELVRCECGCGAEMTRYDRYGRPRRFVSGHNIPRGRQHNGYPG